MSIEAIKAYVDLCLQGDATIPECYALMMKHKEEALAKYEEMKRHIEHLEEKLTLYEAILEGRSPDTTNPANWDRIRHMHRDVFCTSSIR